MALKRTRSVKGTILPHWFVLSWRHSTMLKSPATIHLHVFGNSIIKHSHNLHLAGESFGAYRLTNPISPPGNPWRINHCARLPISDPDCVTFCFHFGCSRVRIPPFPAPGMCASCPYPALASRHHAIA
jgi:hypothetical protein